MRNSSRKTTLPRSATHSAETPAAPAVKTHPEIHHARPEIPFSRLSLVGNEMRYMADAVRNGHCSGDGPFTKRCQELLETELGVSAALLTTSCTHALEMSAILLGIQPGDEVIVPTFTFVTSVNAFVLRGARPVFADVRPDTLNIDETKLEALITPRTRAIVVVHYGGVACEMDSIFSLAARFDIPVIEDNAHGLFGSYKGRPLGSMGAMAALSFHETKNYSCGEGGALIVNDSNLLSRAEIIREKGTDRARFFRGQVDKYTWVDIGSSYVLADMNAGFLLGQLEKWREIRDVRERIWDYYALHLQDWAEANSVGLPHVPADCDQAFHLFYLIMPSLAKRQEFITYLRTLGIGSAFHYVPLHLSPMGRQLGAPGCVCPVAENLADRLVRLPFHNGLSEADQARIVEAVVAFRAVPRGSRSPTIVVA